MSTLVVILLLLLLTFLHPQTFTGKADEQKENLAVEKETSPLPASLQVKDFPSTEEGTFSGQLQKQYFKEPIDDVVVLFVSVKLPGLSLIYYPHEKRIVGGTPQMIIEDVVLFDDTTHEIKYSFQKKGKQSFWYDGKLLVSSEYHPNEANKFTGMMIGAGSSFISPTLSAVEIE